MHPIYATHTTTNTNTNTNMHFEPLIGRMQVYLLKIESSTDPSRSRLSSSMT